MSVLENFKKLKAEGTKIVVVTSHEYWSAKILNDTDVNGILIGDDLNMVVHGHEDTLSCDVETIFLKISHKWAQINKSGQTSANNRQNWFYSIFP